MPSEQLLTADDVADQLQMQPSWVYRKAREGTLPSVQCGRYRRFDAADIERWIAENKCALQDS